MTILDIILIIPLIFALYKGFQKGFFFQLGGIVGIAIGVWLAFRMSDQVGTWLGLDPQISYYVAFILIVLLVLILMGIISFFLSKIFNFVGLGFLNKLGGVIVSLLKTTLILGILLMAFNRLNKYTEMVSPHHIDNSYLYSPIVKTTNYMLPFLKDAVDSIDFTGENE